MNLYSYCLRYDDGAAPNPYWGVCTLAICKPAIRRTAKVNDWVVGLGSANSPLGDISDHLVYAMRISDKRSLWGYDILCKPRYAGKIPDWHNSDFKRRVGDCIYDYSSGPPPRLRLGVHDERNRQRDLSGKNTLISDHFYYFGDHPIKLPQNLLGLIHNQQGHKVKANEPYAEDFVHWIMHAGFEVNKLHGEPQLKGEFVDAEIKNKCADRDIENDDEHDIC